jgi:hypothetical protein
MLCELVLRMENAVKLKFRPLINEAQLVIYAAGSSAKY